MSIIAKRDHPSGGIALTVSAFDNDGGAVLGLGPLRGDMRYIHLSPTEVANLQEALDVIAAEPILDRLQAAFN